jgi:hypothetical protein
MDGIYQANESFDFSKITMISPTIIAGGNYFIKFRMNDIPLYVQTPKCKVKQGFIKSGKKLYCDLMFTRENEDFICWMENLENHCQKKIYENRQKWFETPLDAHDIENSFTSPLKLYKSGKFYLSRTNVPSLLGNCTLKIYNESEELVNPDNLKEEMDVISILEIQGIKCSARSFQIEMELKQMLVMNPVNLFDKFIFKKTKPTASEDPRLLENATISANVEPPEVSIQIPIQVSVQEDPLENGLLEEILFDNTDTPYDNNTIDEANVGQMGAEQMDAGQMDAGQMDAEQMGAEDDVEDVEEEDEEDEDSDDEYRYRDKIVIDHANHLMEIDLDLDDLQEEVHIKKRDDIYYEMYREAKRKAKLARDLAIASYLEAKNIKNTYMIMDDEEDSDLEEETFHNITMSSSHNTM